MSKKKNTRSPLRELPLRNPGQSIDEEINHLYDSLLAPFGYFVGFLAVVLAAWNEYLTKKPLHPTFFTVAALASLGYFIYSSVKIRNRITLLKLARDGELLVGQGLELLREKGFAIFHDIKGDKFNLDHVIVAPHGVFVIETKTYSKPVKGDSRVVYDGKKILVNGFMPARDPIKQIKANTNWLKEMLKKSTGKTFPVKGAVVFPGWFVDSRLERGDPIWVLNPKALPIFIGNEPVMIASSDIHLIAFHLSRYIRTNL